MKHYPLKDYIGKKVYRLSRIEWDKADDLSHLPSILTIEAKDDDEALDEAADKFGHGIEAATVVELLS